MNRIKQHSALWRTLKAHYLGANDCASILGYGFQTIDDVINTKVRGKPAVVSPEVQQRMDRGTRFEPVVRQACALRHGINILETGMKFHKTLSFLTASPDGLFYSSEGEPVLTEFKVLTHLSDGKIPYKYWIQMQIQMAVWGINKCLYCENTVDNNGEVTEFYEHLINADARWFDGTVIPAISTVWQDIEDQRRMSRRLKRKFDDMDGLTFKVKPDMLNNYIRQDPLLDWLNLYGPPDKRDKEISTAYMALSSRRHMEYAVLVQTELSKMHEHLNINTAEVPEICLPANIAVMSTTVSRTRHAIINRAPVIFNACLAAPGMEGHADVIVRNDYISLLFPQFQADAAGYSVILIKYSNLNLKKDGKSLLSNDKQRGYKAQLWLLNKMLSDMTGAEATCGYLIGRGWITAEVKFAEDQELHERALNWLSEVREPHMRDINIAGTPELFPNMKNQYDLPWHTYKLELATLCSDITLMYRCGPQAREQAFRRGVTHWQNLNDERSREFISAQSQITKHGDKIPFEHRIRFYLDFESVNSLCDEVSLAAESRGYIFFAGVLAEDGDTGELRHYSYTAERLCRQSELNLLDHMLRDMRGFVRERDATQSTLPLYYWSNAEKYMIERALHPAPADIEFFDLCKIFRDNKIILPGQFGYGLKEISRLMKKYGLIDTVWEAGISSGMDAMVEAIRTYRYRTDPKVKGLFFEQVKKYNYVDCKVMQEIVAWHRR